MNIFDLIQVDPKEVKVHLAVWNGSDDPLDVFFEGSFKRWQEHQNRGNFSRKYVLSLIRYQSEMSWLFAGIYEVLGSKKGDNNTIIYSTSLTEFGDEFIGRLIVKHARQGRNSYPYGESILNNDNSEVSEIKPEPLAFSSFSSFSNVFLTRSQLEILFRAQYPSWKAALASVSGVYLISDTSNGKLYVGSADGDNGLWGRWASYASTYHGGNKDLRALFNSRGSDGFSSFRYSILETFHLGVSQESVLSSETRWKERLLSRAYGYNSN